LSWNLTLGSNWPRFSINAKELSPKVDSFRSSGLMLGTPFTPAGQRSRQVAAVSSRSGCT
jgi:hypothetical protein